MATIKFVDAADRTFVPAGTTPELKAMSYFDHHPDGGLQLLEIKWEPDSKNHAHAHEIDELVVVTQGSMRFGSRWLGPGSSVLIPRLTLYSFDAGPEGLTVLNFRGTPDRGGITKEELLERKRQEKSREPATQ